MFVRRFYLEFFFENNVTGEYALEDKRHVQALAIPADRERVYAKFIKVR